VPRLALKRIKSFCFFFQKEALFFFEKKNQKTSIRLAKDPPKPGCASARQAIARCSENPPGAFPIPANRSPSTPTGNRRS
jgi:hypothetical protein